MSERCQWFSDPEIGLWHLPGCWGAVVGGPECCYCGPDGDSVEGRLAAIEGQLRQLVAALPTGNESAEGEAPTGARLAGLAQDEPPLSGDTP